jgi:para-nitrobenzyl esterase
VVALEWVRDHIAAFGGDPANVTIFGESGGGAKVASLMGMPAASTLFHRAIIESSPLISFPSAEAAAATTRDVLAKLGIPEGADAVRALQQLTAEELFAVSLTTPDAFVPHTDGVIVPASPFAPGWIPTSVVPLIVGSCTDEFTWFADPALTDENGAALARETLGDHADAILEEYHAEYASDRAAILRAVSDSVFGSFVHRVKAVWTPFAPLYTYVFSWATPVSDGTLGAFHTAELPLVLRHVRYPQSEQLSRQLAGLWSTFARTGQPTFDGVIWPQATPADGSTLIFDEKSASWGADPTRPLFWANRPAIDFSAASAIMAGPAPSSTSPLVQEPSA